MFRDLGFNPNALDFNIYATKALLNYIFSNYTSIKDN